MYTTNTAKTYTATGLMQRAELERIDDMICDLYSGQDNAIVYKHMDEAGREALRQHLNGVIDALRDWRKKYDLD